MRSSKLLHAFLLCALFVLGILITRYYWEVNSLDAIRILPRYLMYMMLSYVLVQIIKRWLFKSRHWWDWVYYIGLVAAMLPTFIASENSAQLFHIITVYGILFLVIPVALDLYTLLKRKG